MIIYPKLREEEREEEEDEEEDMDEMLMQTLDRKRTENISWKWELWMPRRSREEFVMRCRVAERSLA